MQTNTVRLDGDLKGISTQGRLIRQEHQYVMAAYTRTEEALVSTGRHRDGGSSLMVMPRQMKGDDGINRAQIIMTCGMHMQVPYGFPANFSKTVIVRYDHFRGTEDFREWAALLGKRFHSRINIEQAAEELHTLTHIKREFFYFKENNLEGGALMNTATTGKAITVKDEIEERYLPGSD